MTNTVQQRFGGAIEVGALQVGGSGTMVRQVAVFAPALTPAAVAAGTSAEQLFTIPGLASGDIVVAVNKPTAQSGLGIVGVRVDGVTAKLGITFANLSGAVITPTAGEIYSVVVLRL